MTVTLDERILVEARTKLMEAISEERRLQKLVDDTERSVRYFSLGYPSGHDQTVQALGEAKKKTDLTRKEYSNAEKPIAAKRRENDEALVKAQWIASGNLESDLTDTRVRELVDEIREARYQRGKEVAREAQFRMTKAAW